MLLRFALHFERNLSTFSHFVSTTSIKWPLKFRHFRFSLFSYLSQKAVFFWKKFTIRSKALTLQRRKFYWLFCWTSRSNHGADFIFSIIRDSKWLSPAHGRLNIVLFCYWFLRLQTRRILKCIKFNYETDSTGSRRPLGTRAYGLSRLYLITV